MRWALVVARAMVLVGLGGMTVIWATQGRTLLAVLHLVAAPVFVVRLAQAIEKAMVPR